MVAGDPYIANDKCITIRSSGRRVVCPRFAGPTEPQILGWPEIRAGRDVLISAPTGSGKTLAAFLICLDRLVRAARDGALPNETEVVYVSPLKALSNDVHKNLEVPLAEISALAAERGIPFAPIRTAVRTGDTPAAERQKMGKQRPHILVTTPESLYILLTAEKSRDDAADHAHGDRRRDPRRRRRQARIASGAFARAAGRARRDASRSASDFRRR